MENEPFESLDRGKGTDLRSLAHARCGALLLLLKLSRELLLLLLLLLEELLLLERRSGRDGRGRRRGRVSESGLTAREATDPAGLVLLLALSGSEGGLRVRVRCVGQEGLELVEEVWCGLEELGDRRVDL